MQSERITYFTADYCYDMGLVVRDIASAPNPEPGKSSATFFSPDHDTLQVGLLQWSPGHVVPAHYHYERERRTTGTHEVLYVVYGLIAVDFYLDDRTLFRTVELKANDLIVIFGKSHGVRVIGHSRVIEVKQGPYLGRDADKKEI